MSQALSQRHIESQASRTIKSTAKKQKSTTILVTQLTSLLNKN